MQYIINENNQLVLEVAKLQAQLEESNKQLDKLNKIIDWLLITPSEQINNAVEFANQITADYKEGMYSLIREAFSQQ